MAHTIDTVEALRALYAQPGERARRKELAALDAHMRRFIALSPFTVLSTSDAQGRLDASPRGGAPGFVKVDGDGTLLLPDSPGNNRLDSLQNIVAHGQAGLLFLLPGVDETLRVNGAATLSTDPALLARCADGRRVPTLVIRVTVREAYLHCAKALMRSALWAETSRLDRGALPTMNQMIRDQIGGEGPVESQEDMVRRYAADL